MKKSIKTIFTVLLTVYLAVLLRITVFRDGCFSNGLFSGRVEWAPFTYLYHLLEIGYWSYFIYLFVGNLFWFVPLGSYVCCKRRPFWQAVLAGFALSVLIETLQFVLGSGVTEVEDVILNTCGTMLGYGLTAIFVKRDKSKWKRSNQSYRHND